MVDGAGFVRDGPSAMEGSVSASHPLCQSAPTHRTLVSVLAGVVRAGRRVELNALASLHAKPAQRFIRKGFGFCYSLCLWLRRLAVLSTLAAFTSFAFFATLTALGLRNLCPLQRWLL